MSTFMSIHIPKCGGASLKMTFKRALGDRFMPDYGNRVVAGDLRSLRARRARKQRMLQSLHLFEHTAVVHGHYYASKYVDAPFEKKWITFVRNPADLVISYYYYARDGNGTLAEIARELSLEEFAEHPFFANVITRVTHPLEPEDFSFIGFTETYSDSLKALSDLLGIELVENFRNVNSTNTTRSSEADPQLLKIINKFNGLDFDWYERAKAHAASLSLPVPA